MPAELPGALAGWQEELARLDASADLAALESGNRARYLAAHEAAMAAPSPDPASIHDFVIPEPWVSPLFPDGTHSAEGERVSLITALNQTLKEEFRHNPDTFIWGQDMANKDKGGIFNVSKGLQQEFGADRVFNGPIAEDYIVGTANGFSRLDDKIRVVVEGAEFADYIWPAAEQIVECSHDYWRTKGQFSPNVTIRIASGGYIGGGLYHSQNVEGWLTSLPGIRVVVPAFADDAAGLLRTAIRCEDPVLFLEPKHLYRQTHNKGADPGPDFMIPFGKARVVREGADLSVITFGNTVHRAAQAAREAEKEGLSVEILDLRSLNPYDWAAIERTVKKTHRVLVAHEDTLSWGYGAEIAARIADELFFHLDAPVKRLAAQDTWVAYAPAVEDAILPQPSDFLNAYRTLAGI